MGPKKKLFAYCEISTIFTEPTHFSVLSNLVNANLFKKFI